MVTWQYLRTCLSESSLASDEALRTEIPARELEEGNVAEIGAGRNWMWACARSVETKQPINIYAYAARSADKWLFDMHLGEKGAIPCFGLQVPHVYVPISEIFISVYNDYKKILGVTPPRTLEPTNARSSSGFKSIPKIRIDVTVGETVDDNCFRAADDDCLRWPLLSVEFVDEAFCLCPAAKCVSGVPFLCFAGGSLKAV